DLRWLLSYFGGRGIGVPSSVAVTSPSESEGAAATPGAPRPCSRYQSVPRAPSRTERSRPGTCATCGSPRSSRAAGHLGNVVNDELYGTPGVFASAPLLGSIRAQHRPPRGAVLVLPRLADHDPGLQLTDKPLAGHALRLL